MGWTMPKSRLQRQIDRAMARDRRRTDANDRPRVRSAPGEAERVIAEACEREMRRRDAALNRNRRIAQANLDLYPPAEPAAEPATDGPNQTD